VQNIIARGGVNYGKECHSSERSPTPLIDFQDIVIVIHVLESRKLVSGFLVGNCSRMSSGMLPWVIFFLVNGLH
jgi:hypothetical protein